MANEKGEKLALHLDDLISDSDPVLIKDADLGVVNSSGHVQELERQFSRLSLISMSTVIDNAWVALAGSILTSLYNGGPPGAIYELIVASFFYFFIAACLAELASSIPSSANVYHWASITAGPKYGRLLGFLAGWWNFFGWVVGCASSMSIMGNVVIQIWALNHPDFTPQPWHVFVVYLICTWCGCAVVIFGHKLLPRLNSIGLFAMLSGLLVTIITCAVMPGMGDRPPHAPSSFVWSDWSSDLGYDSQGFVFLLGMLTGAFTIGTPDSGAHLCEEIPHPEINVPIAIASQMTIGFVTSLAYLIAIFYAISDLSAIQNAGGVFPIAQIYLQATSSPAGASGLLAMIFMVNIFNIISVQVTASRMLWTIARDKGAPFAKTISHVSRKHGNPIYAQVAVSILTTLLGCIYVGNQLAFAAFLGAFVVFTTASYVAAILPNLITRRRHVIPGPFYMKGIWGDIVMTVASVYILVFIVIYCFPFTLPATGANMNYSSLIFGAFTLFMGVWWFAHARIHYPGPIVMRKGIQITGVRYSSESEQPA